MLMRCGVVPVTWLIAIEIGDIAVGFIVDSFRCTIKRVMPVLIGSESKLWRPGQWQRIESRYDGRHAEARGNIGTVSTPCQVGATAMTVRERQKSFSVGQVRVGCLVKHRFGHVIGTISTLAGVRIMPIASGLTLGRLIGPDRVRA